MALAQRQAAHHDYDIEYSNDELNNNAESANNSTSQLTTSQLTARNAATSTSRNRLSQDEHSHNPDFNDHADFASRRVARSRHNAERHNAQFQEDEALPHSYREWEQLARDASRDEKQSARLASRRAHRAFRMTWVTSLAGTILFAQLLGVLYFKALAVSASHRAKDLEKLIAVEEAAIDKTQRKVSLVSNDPRMEKWAEKAGYRSAMQSDIDDVMNPKPFSQTLESESLKQEEPR